jgi:decaprenyl-phosphate phosphoribosyltransferase
VKNLVVLVLPVAAGDLTAPGMPGRLALAVAAFCCVASGTYLLNDAWDVEEDRLHPRKRSRPVASGRLGVLEAERAGVGLLVCGVGIAALVGGSLALVVVGYGALTTAYSVWLKHEPVVDVIALATCFVLRAAGGAVAVGAALDAPLLATVGFGALLVGVGKRLGEQQELGVEAVRHRRVLGLYPAGFLAQLATVGMVGALIAYALWAVGASRSGVDHRWLSASVVPFTVAVLRYGYVVARGEASDPEAAVVGDPVLRIAVVACVLAALVGIYVA